MSKRSKIHFNLYLDTNVYLTFYHFSKDDLTSLHKLITFINTDNVILHLPTQTTNEFRRNREVRILDALNKLKESRLSDTFPRIAFHYPELKEMQSAIKSYEKNKSQLLEKIQSDAQSGSLKADDVITSLFEKANEIETTEDIYDRAVVRYNSGNPPGKDKSYGDAINWESLLEAVPDGEDLHFISEDGDFYSKLNQQHFNTFLLKEWEQIKRSKLHYYKTLSDFLKKNLPDIEIGTETEKDVVIQNLSTAGNFTSAKNVVSKLRSYDNFSIQQLNDIAQAFTSNNQIYWIADDYVIRQAREEIIEANEKNIEKGIYKAYRKRFEEET